MRKSLYAASCLAVLGVGLALASPTFAESPAAVKEPMPAPMGMHMRKGPMSEEMQKHHEEKMKLYKKMDETLAELKKDQEQLKTKGSDKALLAKLDKDLTTLQETHKKMREHAEQKREAMEKHREMMMRGPMGGASGEMPAPPSGESPAPAQ